MKHARLFNVTFIFRKTLINYNYIIKAYMYMYTIISCILIIYLKCHIGHQHTINETTLGCKVIIFESKLYWLCHNAACVFMYDIEVPITVVIYIKC